MWGRPDGCARAARLASTQAAVAAFILQEMGRARCASIARLVVVEFIEEEQRRVVRIAAHVEPSTTGFALREAAALASGWRRRRRRQMAA